MNHYSFIIVSNRLPVSVYKKNGKLIYTHSSGGLATAMSSLNTDIDDNGTTKLWIGWPGISKEETTPNERARIVRELKKYGCYPVFLSRDQVSNYYSGYANDTLWPLFHYFQSLTQYDEAYWDAYQEVNSLFCKAIEKKAEANASVWIHDYHLMLLPALVRKSLPKASIGYFLHIPFPSHEIFRQLPNRKRILEGLLGADLIGFHIYDYARHFLSSALRLLGIESYHSSITYQNRVIRVDAFPIGIDYPKFSKTLDDPKTQQAIKVLHDHYKDQKIIISVDRLDYTKGMLQRLEAYEKFLKENPKYIRKVVLVLIAVPSRTEVGAYKDLRRTIEQTVSRINGAYSTMDWMPISYQFKNLPFEQVVALYAAADIALVTPLRDGMNLVAKEYIASRQKGQGVLILSEMAGVADELPEAIRINPNSVRSILDAIRTALNMPKKEQKIRIESMQKRLSDYTVQRWASDFIEHLENTKKTQAEQNNKVLDSELKKQLMKSFSQAKRRTILLDYDGTIRKFVDSPNPHLARPSKSLLTLIDQLARKDRAELVIVSGRTREALESWFGKLPIKLAAEHGAWIKRDKQWSKTEARFDDYKSAILEVLNHYLSRTPGASVEEKDFSLVWHYRNVPTELAYARNASLKHALDSLLANTDISIYRGNKIIEIKPRNINKGAAAQQILGEKMPDFLLCIGDDYTDEDMFEALPEDAFTIKIGLGETRARYQISDIDEVLALLKSLKAL